MTIGRKFRYGALIPKMKGLVAGFFKINLIILNELVMMDVLNVTLRYRDSTIICHHGAGLTWVVNVCWPLVPCTIMSML